MKKKYLFLITCVVSIMSYAQTNYSANGGTSFGGPLGTSSMEITHDATNVYFNVTKGNTGATFDNFFVIYIDNGSTGRTVINNDVNDLQDSHRRAISNSNSANLTFPPGFDATHAIAVDDIFGGVWSIPATGTVGNNGLNFLNSVGSSNGPTEFTMTLAWSDLGLSSTDSFQFVGTYGNPNDPNNVTFSSNEGYGDGILNNGNQNGTDAMTFITHFEYPSGDKHGIARNVDSNPLPDAWSFDYSWANGNPPNSTDEIIIEHNIAMDVDVTVDNSLTVNSGVVGIVSTQIFTLNGSLTVMPTINPFAPIEFGFDSDANGSAQFINGPMATITGNVGVARFVPTGSTSNRRAFRFITSSVNTTTNIFQNWQTNGLNLLPGLGTHITGSTTGANGFDATATGNPSLFIYAENPDPMISTYNFQAVTATNTAGIAGHIRAGQAFNLFVRGDRNYDLVTAPALPNADVRIPTRGSLVLDATVNSGALNPNEGGFSFIGNPYQATINMSTVTKNNVNPNFIYIWNPNAATRGAYETIALTGTGPLSAKRFVQPGQAFFMQTISAGAASLDFSATDKAVMQNAPGPFSIPNNRPQIELSLYRDLNGTSTIFDQLSIYLDGNNALELNDAAKIQNFEESLSRNLNGNLLSIENRAMPNHNEVIALDLKNIAATNYTLNIDVNALTVGMEAILHDNFLNTDTVLVDGANTVNLSFDINNPLSIDASRFELKFVDGTLSTSQVEDFTFKMYPNPSSNGQVILAGDFSQENTSATFYNTLGQQVFKTTIDSNETTINVQNLDAGIYLVNIVSGKDSVTQKLVIK